MSQHPYGRPLLQYSWQAADVVQILMGDQDGIQPVPGHSCFGKSRLEGLCYARIPGIDEHDMLVVPHQHGINPLASAHNLRFNLQHLQPFGNSHSTSSRKR
ncbi:hypothetical protein D3C73_1455070 [compost metagenome]